VGAGYHAPIESGRKKTAPERRVLILWKWRFLEIPPIKGPKLSFRAYNYILPVFDKPDPEIDKLWAKEATRRQKAMRTGKMKTLPYEAVMEKYLK
jgi:hypothetical protein